MTSVKAPYPFGPDAYDTRQEPPPYSETAPEAIQYPSDVDHLHSSTAYSHLPEVVRNANQFPLSIAASQSPESARTQTRVDQHVPTPTTIFSQLPEAMRVSSTAESSTSPVRPLAQVSRQSDSVPEASHTSHQYTANQPSQSSRPFLNEKISSQVQSRSRLMKPIAIPATSPNIGSPFLRAWPTDLADFGISKETFLSCLDELNEICVENPPIIAVDLTGTILGFVPLQNTRSIGGSVNIAPKPDTAAPSKGRTEYFLHDINVQVFGPRNLKIEIAKLGAIAKISGMPVLADSQITKNDTTLRSIDDVEQLQLADAQGRGLEALEPYIAQLEIAPLPEIADPTYSLNEQSVEMSEKQRSKSEARCLRERSKAAERFEWKSFKIQRCLNKKMRKLDEEEAKVQRKEGPEKLGRELEKIERERAKVAHKYERKSSKLGKIHARKHEEEKSIREILFLVIRNADADSRVDTGINLYM